MNPVAYLETAVLYCDDNLRRLTEFPADCVDLVYLDPPFFSNRNYEVIWGDEAEVRSFEDRWEGGINVYLDWMSHRLRELHRILKPTGSLYLHCDWHASHHLRVLLDEIFGASKFRNEIIWHYRRWTGEARSFLKMHDTLFFYTKTNEYTFNRQFTEYTEASVKRKKNYHTRIKGDETYVTSVDERGVAENDVWQLSVLNSQAKERLGYPTQKPEALLERVIAASSKENDIVLDPFAGCGTTQVVAERMDRQWIGIDISPTAVNLMRRRLLTATNGAADVKLIGMPTTAEDLRALKPFEFQNWVMQQTSATASPRKSRDGGIDGFSFMYHDPIQVKQSEKVGRITVDNFETAIKRAKADRGFIVALSFTRDAREEVARAKVEDGIEIALVTVEDLLLATEALTRPTQDPVIAEEMFPKPSKPWRGPTRDHKRLLAALAESADLPPIIAPKAEARPSSQDLVDSQRGSA
jgi:DNA modification methylase